jgi:hypothetical protein
MVFCLQTAAPRLHQGHSERLARRLGNSRVGICFDQCRITAVRKLAVEGVDNGLLAPELADAIARVKGAKSKGVRVGNWLSKQQAQKLLNAPNVCTKKGMRDRAMRRCSWAADCAGLRWRRSTG